MHSRVPALITAAMLSITSIARWTTVNSTQQGAAHDSRPGALAQRLGQQYRVNASGAIPVALELAAREDSVARQLFVHWIHFSLATEFVPRLSLKAQEGFYDELLGALSAPRESYSARVTEGLRMWHDAQRAETSQAMRALLAVEPPIPDAYGPRYQLLLYDRLDKAQDAGIRAEVDRRRRALAGSMLDYYRVHSNGALADAVRYWAAYAASAVGKSQRPGSIERLKAIETGALLSPLYSLRRARPWWREARALGGPVEFITPSAELCETQGRWECALSERLELARLDPRALPALAAVYSRLHSPSSFGRYWEEERWKRTPSLPESIDGKTRPPVPAWRIIAVSSTDDSMEPATAAQLEALRGEFPGQVFSVVLAESDNDLTRATASVAHSARISASEVDELQIFNLPAVLLVSPDGRYVSLDPDHWADDAARHMAFKQK
jgi:hypothetical protein